MFEQCTIRTHHVFHSENCAEFSSGFWLSNMPVQIQSQRNKAAKPSITVQEDMGWGTRGGLICLLLRKTAISSFVCSLSLFLTATRSTGRRGSSSFAEARRGETRLRASLVLLLGLLLDGAHRRDDRGLGAAGSGGHRHHRGQGGGGGDDGGLGQCHGDGRVPFAFPLLRLRCWEKTGSGVSAVTLQQRQ